MCWDVSLVVEAKGSSVSDIKDNETEQQAAKLYTDCYKLVKSDCSPDHNLDNPIIYEIKDDRSN